jgi:hypothetical protein
MSENIKQNIMGYRSCYYNKNNGRQSFNNQTDRIASVATSNINNGGFHSSETLRFHRKVYR